MTTDKTALVTEETLWQEEEQREPLYSPRTGTRYEIAEGFTVALKRLTHGLQKRYLAYADDHQTPLYLDEVDAQAETWWREQQDLFVSMALKPDEIRAERRMRPLADIQADAVPHQYALVQMICEPVEEGAAWPDVDDLIPKMLSRVARDFTRARNATAPPERPLSPGQVAQIQALLTQLLPQVGGVNGLAEKTG